MANKKKKYGKKPYLREDAVKNSIFLEEINKNPIKKKLPPQAYDYFSQDNDAPA